MNVSPTHFMEPKLGLHNSRPLRVSTQYPAGLSSAAPSSSAAAGPRVSDSASIVSTQPLNAAAVASPPPIQLASSSLQLLQEIEETRKLLRTFRSLKERGASRAELADLHSRVKALKAAQQCQQKYDTGPYNELPLPVATCTTLDTTSAAITQPSLVYSTQALSPSWYARRHAGVALHGGEAGRTVGSSSSLHQSHPQKQRGLVEAHATHRNRQLHEGRPHRRHNRHEVHANPAASLPISTSLTTAITHASMSLHDGVGNAVSSSNTGTRSATAQHPNGVSSVVGSLVQLHSIVFAIALAEAHLRREIAHRWERRWLRHWANFKEERIAIALRPPATPMATVLRPQLLPERWAEASPMALPREQPQCQQSKQAATSAAEVSSVVTIAKAHIIGASLAPGPGRGTGETFTAPTSSLVAKGLLQRPSLSTGDGSGGEWQQTAELHGEEVAHVNGTSVEEDTVLWASPLQQYRPQPVASATKRDAEASSCAAADARTLASRLVEAQAAAAAAERLATALRCIEDDEAAVRIATESAAAEAQNRVKLAEVAARCRAEEAWKALQSLVFAEATARVGLEGDEASSRASHVAAAEVAARRRAQEEGELQEAAARTAAVMRDEKAQRTAARRAAEAHRQAAADAEAAERRSIELQWQADVRLAESLLAGWITDAVAAALQPDRSKDTSALERPPRDKAKMEDAQTREATEAQADLREREQALERCVATFSAATNAVLGELISAAATEAVARERQIEQVASADVVRRRREEEEAAARAKAVADERASVTARAAVLWAEENGRAAFVTSEEEAWQLQQEAADVEVTYLETLAPEEQARHHAEWAEDTTHVEVEMNVNDDAIRLAVVEEAACLQVELSAAASGDQLECDAAKAREAAAAAALTATLCSVVTELSKNIVDGCLAEAAQQARKQGEAATASAARDRAAVEELQMERREKIEDEVALARDRMHGDALDELKRLRDTETAAEVRKRMAVKAMAAVKEPERQQQQQQQKFRRAAAQCLHLSEWCEALLLDFLHDAASAAVSVVKRTATIANERPFEVPLPVTLAEEEENEASAVTEGGQQHHRPPSTGEATAGPGALTEQMRVDDVDSPGKASVKAVAQESVAATASPPLSPSSSASPSALFMDSVSADATPGAVATDALKGPTDEYVRLPSPTGFVRLVDGLLSDVFREAAMAARKGGAINEAVASQADAAQRSRRDRVPVLDGSDASLALFDSGGSCSSSVRSPPQALQMRPLALPSAFVVSAGSAGNHVQQVRYTGNESNDCAEVDVVGGTGSATLIPAAVSEVDDSGSHRHTLSPLLMPPVDVITNAAAVSPASAAAVTERSSANCATTAVSSPLHCFSTASSVEDDDDAACRPFTAPEAPLPLHLHQRSVLSPLLSQRPGRGGCDDDDSGEASTPAGCGGGDDGAAADTTTGTALAMQERHRSPVVSSRDPASGADGTLSAAMTMAGSATEGITEDLRAFQLDAPSPPHGETEHRAEETVVAAETFRVDTVVAVAISLVDRMVHDATLVAASLGQSGAALPSRFSSAQGHAQGTAEGKRGHNGSSASTSCSSNGSGSGKGSGGLASSRVGGSELHAEKRVIVAESTLGLTSADTRETALHVSRSSSPAAAAVAAEGITGPRSPLASLSTLTSAVAAPNHFEAHLRQQEAEKAVAHQQNRYLTNRELALVAARYLTSEVAAGHVMEIGPTATLSARAVALVLSVGLVRVATLENRRARRRVEEAENGGSSSTSGEGILADEKRSPKSAQGSGAASALNNPTVWLPSMSGCGGGYGFPTRTFDKPGAEKGIDDGGGIVDVPPASPSTRCHGRGDGFGSIGPAGPSAVGCAEQGSGIGEVKEADMCESLMSRGGVSPSQQGSPSSGSASQSPAFGDVKGGLASNAAQLQAGVRDKLPADWATALRGVAERIARDFMDYASRCILLGQGEGQSNQANLRTAQRIHSDALARIDVQALFTHELRMRDVARLTCYYVELATNGPRDRVDPHCAPAALGDYNIFGRRSRGDVEGNDGAPGFDRLDAASTTVSAPLTRLQCPSSSLSRLRRSSLLSAATAIHVRRAGLLQLVLEQCVSNVLHDLVGDTVGWLWAAYLQATPSGAAADEAS